MVGKEGRGGGTHDARMRGAPSMRARAREKKSGREGRGKIHPQGSQPKLEKWMPKQGKRRNGNGGLGGGGGVDNEREGKPSSRQPGTQGSGGHSEVRMSNTKKRAKDNAARAQKCETWGERGKGGVGCSSGLQPRGQTVSQRRVLRHLSRAAAWLPRRPPPSLPAPRSTCTATHARERGAAQESGWEGPLQPRFPSPRDLAS